MTAKYFHVAVWIDHRSARIFSFGHDDADKTLVRHNDSPHQIHHKSGSIGSGHVEEDVLYMSDVAKALETAGEILILGPAQVKHELKTYLDSRAPQIGAKVVGVESADHPGDGVLLAMARKYFRRVDLLATHQP